MKISRDARQMLNTLTEVSGRETSITDVFIATQLAYSFFGKTVSAHIKRMYNPNSKANPHEMQFYVKPTLSLNKGRRNKEEWILTEQEQNNLMRIGGYLIEDYNYDQLKQMRLLCAMPEFDVKEGIEIAKEEQVYSIPYLYRIVEGIEARKEHKRQQMHATRKMVHTDTGSKVNSRTPLELASLMAEWQETIQNVELEEKVNKLYRGK